MPKAAKPAPTKECFAPGYVWPLGVVYVPGATTKYVRRPPDNEDCYMPTEAEIAEMALKIRKEGFTSDRGTVYPPWGAPGSSWEDDWEI